MHMSTSLSHELKINVALAEYPPLSFCILDLWIFLNSSAMSCRLCDAMEASCLVLLTFWYGVRLDLVPKFGLLSAWLSISFPDVSVSGILDRLKDTGWGAKQGIDDTDPGLTTWLLNITLCPWPLPAMGVSGTWGRWDTSSSLKSLPLFIFLVWDAVPCFVFTVPSMTLNMSSLNRVAWSFKLNWPLI